MSNDLQTAIDHATDYSIRRVYLDHVGGEHVESVGLDEPQPDEEGYTMHGYGLYVRIATGKYAGELHNVADFATLAEAQAALAERR